MAKDTGKVDIHGKEYLTVAYRVGKFREDHPGYSIITEVFTAVEKQVIMKATILDDKSRVLATGFAEEDRTKGSINKTSALENCETSAVGRALAFYGYAGSEIASADEVANAICQQNQGGQQSKPQPSDEDKDGARQWLNDDIPMIQTFFTVGELATYERNTKNDVQRLYTSGFKDMHKEILGVIADQKKKIQERNEQNK